MSGTLFSAEEVSKHHSAEDCWIIIGAEGSKKVYDITAFLEDHPGGPEVLLDLAGQDVQDEFEDIGHSKEARAMLEQLCIGSLLEEKEVQMRFEAKRMERMLLLTHPEMIGLPKTKKKPLAGLVFACFVAALAWLYYEWKRGRKFFSQ